MTKPLTTEQLREEITNLYMDGATNRLMPGIFADSVMAKIKDHVEYVIGEDEVVNSEPFADKRILSTEEDKINLFKNELRAEQRNRAGGY